MGILLVAILISGILKDVYAGSYSSCEVEGVQYWTMATTLKNKIEDIHEGEIITLRTDNILEMKSFESEGDYFTAKFEKSKLIISTGERFKFFEEERKQKLADGRIKMTLDFQCNDGYSEDLELVQIVIDTNNHDPILDRSLYEYHFGLPLSEGYDLTELLPIRAVDDDFQNKKIFFQIDANEDLHLGYSGKTKDYGRTYYTTLTTLRELKAPFRREFVLTVTDSPDVGTPRSTTAKLIVAISDSDDLKSKLHEEEKEENEENNQPPLFSKHLYYATYSSNNKLELEEPIVITGATSETKIIQDGYLSNFKVNLVDSTKGEITMETLTSLPAEVLKNEKLIAIEIQAENEGVSIPGRTILIITLPKDNKPGKFKASLIKDDSGVDNSREDETGENKSRDCNVTYISDFHYTEGSLPLILCICGILLIALTNVVVLGLYFSRRKVKVIATSGNQMPKQMLF